jgi:hypothetical protein
VPVRLVDGRMALFHQPWGTCAGLGNGFPDPFPVRCAAGNRPNPWVFRRNGRRLTGETVRTPHWRPRLPPRQNRGGTSTRRA